MRNHILKNSHEKIINRVIKGKKEGKKELGRFLVQCGSVAQSPGGGRLRDPSILIFKILGAGRRKKIIVEFKNTQNCENTNVHTMYLFDVMSSSLKNWL